MSLFKRSFITFLFLTIDSNKQYIFFFWQWEQIACVRVKKLTPWDRYKTLMETIYENCLTFHLHFNSKRKTIWNGFYCLILIDTSTFFFHLVEIKESQNRTESQSSHFTIKINCHSQFNRRLDPVTMTTLFPVPWAMAIIVSRKSTCAAV